MAIAPAVAVEYSLKNSDSPPTSFRLTAVSKPPMSRGFTSIPVVMKLIEPASTTTDSPAARVKLTFPRSGLPMIWYSMPHASGVEPTPCPLRAAMAVGRGHRFRGAAPQAPGT